MRQKLLVLFLTLSTIISTAATANTQNEKDFVILSPFEIMKVIGDFPAQGSAAEAEDLAYLLKVQDERTAEDCRLASKQEIPSIGSMFGGKKGPLTNAEVEEMNVALLKHYGEAVSNAYIGKKLYARPRPYITFPEVQPCIKLESSESYPSGHATLARVLARLLAHKYPARTQAFLKRANEAAMNRIIGGVHYPSDVKAGIKLGDHLAKKIIQKMNRRGYDD